MGAKYGFRRCKELPKQMSRGSHNAQVDRMLGKGRNVHLDCCREWLQSRNIRKSKEKDEAILKLSQDKNLKRTQLNSS
jgi:hypothetical protein